MAWKDKLQPASFRGVPFHVVSEEGAFGRRNQLHEYPGRDKPLVEDLGRSARDFTVSGFLIGADYLDQRDRLLEALETKGSGTLVHPWYGEMTVSVKEPGRVSHSNENGGMCSITVSFIESGELSFPSASSSHGKQTLSAADNMQSVCTNDFAKNFSIDGHPSFVLDDAVKVFSQNLGLLESGTAGMGGMLSSPLSGVRSAGRSLMPDAFGLADTVFSLFNRSSSVVQGLGNIFGGGGSSARNRDSVRALVNLSSAYNTRANVEVPTGISPSRAQVAANNAALNNLFSNAVLVQAAGMTAVMDLPVYDDAVDIRKGVTSALDTQSLAAADDVYIAMQDLRTKVHSDVTARLANSARMTTIEPRGRMPALVLAYDRYENVDRESEIVGLNGIRRPGFVPMQPIKVLSV